MAKSVVTLYIENRGIRLLVAKGRRVEKWAYLPLEAGLISDGVIDNEAKVAAKIKELLKEQDIKANKVVTGLSGPHCLSRLITLPKLPKDMLPEAIRQEAESILPVPMEQNYISWQTIRTSKEEIEVFLATSSRNAMDSLIKTLRQAGLDPYLIDIKPLALARVVDRPTAVIVDTQPTELDIIIMVDGIPQTVRTLSLSSKTPTLSGKLPTILEDLKQTIKFYDSSHSEKPLDPETPVFVSGELAQDSKACKSLAGELKHPVLPLASPLECPEGLTPGQYMVNIGLALKELSLPKGEANFSLVNLNTLPQVSKPKPVSLTRVLIVPGIIVIALGLLFPMVTRVQDAAAETALLRGELDTINQLIQQRLVQKKDIAKLEEKAGEAEASLATFTAVVAYIDDQRFQVNSSLQSTTSAMPDAVDLTSVVYRSNELEIDGMAPSEVEVLSYAKKLRESGIFSEVTVARMEKTCDGMKFGLLLNTGG